MAKDSKQTDTSLSAKLAKEFGRDPKKTTMLAVLLLVGVIFGLRMLKKQSPSSAEGGTLAGMEIFTGDSAPQGPTIPFRGFEDSHEPKDLDIESMNLEVTRDLFSFDASYFQRIPRAEPDPDGPDDTHVTRVPAVSEAERIATVNDQAGVLALQSTMASNRPVAMINGKVLGVGDRIEGFDIVHISTGRCVVEKDGVQVSLQMVRDK